jgi:hypothetical protein
MKVNVELVRTLALGMVVAGSVAAATVAVGARTPCEFQCGDCTVTYVNCAEPCSGSGCDTQGVNCQGACWSCSDGSHGCSG